VESDSCREYLDSTVHYDPAFGLELGVVLTVRISLLLPWARFRIGPSRNRESRLLHEASKQDCRSEKGSTNDEGRHAREVMCVGITTSPLQTRPKVIPTIQARMADAIDSVAHRHRRTIDNTKKGLVPHREARTPP
jgi:hypothetical protein